MARGKQTCKILKEIRKQIAEENDIELVTSECTYQGDCLGTCPKCEAEVRYLERELEKRQRMGKAAVFAGMTIGTAITAAACGPLLPPPDGMLEEPWDTVSVVDTVQNDSVDEPFLLEGDVVAPVPDSIETDAIGKQEKKTSCPSDMLLEIVGGIEVDDVTEGFIAPEVGEVEDSDMVDVYMFVEQMPAFPGGEEKLIEFVSKNVEYPQEAKEEGVQGRVFVGFVVEKDGSVGDVKLLRGIGHGCDEEAVRVVKMLPKWKPGMHNGEIVRVSYQIPIYFKLEDKQD